MPGAQVLLIAALAGGLYLGGMKAVHGLKKLGHKIEHVLHGVPDQKPETK